MSDSQTLFLPVGYTLTLSTDSVTTGTYTQLNEPGGSTHYSPVSLTVSDSDVIGPFNSGRWYIINSNGGVVTTSMTYEAVDNEMPIYHLGTPETGITATEYGDQHQHTTVLTVDTTLPSIAGGADLGLGKLLYTFPDGACVVSIAYMNMAITQTEDNITADTPEVGLGTTLASGVVSVLSGTAAFENVLTGQVAADCDGTATVKTVANQVLVIESGDDHTLYFNVADGWAASGDAGALLTGTIVLNWHFIE